MMTFIRNKFSGEVGKSEEVGEYQEVRRLQRQRSEHSDRGEVARGTCLLPC